jgi:L-threonylcarbamoyladenylate synthase
MRVFFSPSDPEVARLLREGAVGVIPTDTVYGLAASVKMPPAVARLYQLKQREHKPGTTIAANAAELRELGVPADMLEKASGLWPNALSILLPVSEQYSYLHQGLGDCAFRVPLGPPELRQLLNQTGPLSTSSANQPGRPPATNLAEAQAYFGSEVDFYVDGGPIGQRPPSTIIRIKHNGEIELIRAGAVTIDEKGVIAK